MHGERCAGNTKNIHGQIQSALNMLGRIIGEVESEVEKSHREGQITLEEWIEMLNERLED